MNCPEGRVFKMRLSSSHRSAQRAVTYIETLFKIAHTLAISVDIIHESHALSPDNEWPIWVDLNVSDVVRMRLPRLHLLHGVVIVHTKVHIIRACYDPLLPHNEFSTSDRHFAHLERFDQSLKVAKAIIKCPFNSIRRNLVWGFVKDVDYVACCKSSSAR